jgi:hypothetical protein
LGNYRVGLRARGVLEGLINMKSTTWLVLLSTLLPLVACGSHVSGGALGGAIDGDDAAGATTGSDAGQLSSPKRPRMATQKLASFCRRRAYF